MDMVGTGVVFVIVWWLSFFCMLPIGVHTSTAEDEHRVKGCQTGAPQNPMIAKKAIWASFAALIITAGLYVVIAWLRA